MISVPVRGSVRPEAADRGDRPAGSHSGLGQPGPLRVAEHPVVEGPARRNALQGLIRQFHVLQCGGRFRPPEPSLKARLIHEETVPVASSEYPEENTSKVW